MRTLHKQCRWLDRSVVSYPDVAFFRDGHSNRKGCVVEGSGVNGVMLSTLRSDENDDEKNDANGFLVGNSMLFAAL